MRVISALYIIRYVVTELLNNWHEANFLAEIYCVFKQKAYICPR